MGTFFINPYRQIHPDWDENISAEFRRDDIFSLHQSLPNYKVTPLVHLPGLAARLGVGQVFVKDESLRFGLKAFKALGATYAIYRFIRTYLEEKGKICPEVSRFYKTDDIIEARQFTFCTATDGNHGRGVAWAARLLNQRAVIYMPANTVKARVDNIKGEGAEVIIVDGTYDDAVKTAAADATRNGWQIISDTSWESNDIIPRRIMAGYLTLFHEIHQASDCTPDIVLIQAGVGALAAAASYYYNSIYSGDEVRLVCVEPTGLNCHLESARKGGEPVSVAAKSETIMAGLNCGTPSPAAWPFVKTGFDLFMSIPDSCSLKAMRTFYYPDGNDPRIISGESGAAGLGALLALCEDKSTIEIRKLIGLNADSKILLLNTEGDTDPVHFRRVIGHNS